MNDPINEQAACVARIRAGERQAEGPLLKPCPFCGSEVVRDYVSDEYHREISCAHCGIAMWMSDEDWNTRALPPEQPNADTERNAFTITTFLDQIDAASPEIEFWNSIKSGTCPVSMDAHPHRGEGGATTAIYEGSKLIGLTIVMRDELNRTVLVCADTRTTN